MVAAVGERLAQQPWRYRSWWVAACGAGVFVILAAGLSYALPDLDVVTDADGVVRWLVASLRGLRWPLAICLVAVSVVHYSAAAVAARAAAGVRMPFGELLAAQLAATSANRITPAGLGGAGLLGRYFVKRGWLTPARAVTAVSALAVLGAAADVLAFAVLVGAGTLIGRREPARRYPCWSRAWGVCSRSRPASGRGLPSQPSSSLPEPSHIRARAGGSDWPGCGRRCGGG